MVWDLLPESSANFGEDLHYNNSTENKHPIDNLPQRYSNYGSTSTSRFMDLLQHLGFLTNLQKSRLKPNTKLEFLVVEINSVDIATYLSEEKITDITNLCKKLLLQENTTLRELTSLIGKLISTYQAVFLATLHCCSSQMYQITKLKANLCCEDKISLNAASLEELKWWCHNLNLNKGRPTNVQNAEIIIQLDAAKLGGWGAHCQGLTTGSQWSKTKAQTTHKCFRNESSEIVNRVVFAGRKKNKISSPTNRQRHLVKMGGTKSTELNKFSKENWEYLIGNKIKLTAEYLPSSQNIQEDWESCHTKDSSEWKMCPQIFFASRLSHQLSRYMSWKLDPCCRAVGALQQK